MMRVRDFRCRRLAVRTAAARMLKERMNAVPPHNSAETQRATRLVLGLLLLSAAWAAAWFLHALGAWDDAAFLHLLFARSLAQHRGFLLNGRAVYADTAPLWLWLLVAIHAIIPRWLLTGKLLTALAAGCFLTGLFAFARSLTKSLGTARSRLFAAAMLLLTVSNPSFCAGAFDGTEALFAAGLLCWGLVAAQGSLKQPMPPRRLLWGGVCAGLAPLLRPELAVFTALLGLVLFLRWVNTPLRLRPKLLLFFATFGLVAGPFLGWLFYTIRVFGILLPEGMAAYGAAPHASVTGRLLRLSITAFPLVPAGLAGMAIAVLRRFDTRPGSTAGVTAGALGIGGWIIVALTAFECLFYPAIHRNLILDDLLVTAPALTVALLAVARLSSLRWYRAGLAFGLLAGVSTSLLASWPLVRNQAIANRDEQQLAQFLRTLPAGEAVALRPANEVTFFADRPIVDMSGITRPGVISFLWDVPENRRLWWAHEQGARFLVLNRAPEPGSTLLWSRALPGTPFSLDPRSDRTSTPLSLWKLPPSPTLPLPPTLPGSD